MRSMHTPACHPAVQGRRSRHSHNVDGPEDTELSDTRLTQKDILCDPLTGGPQRRHSHRDRKQSDEKICSFKKTTPGEGASLASQGTGLVTPSSSLSAGHHTMKYLGGSA